MVCLVLDPVVFIVIAYVESPEESNYEFDSCAL